MAEQLKIVIDAEVDKALKNFKKFEDELKKFSTGSVKQLEFAAAGLRNQLESLSASARNSDFGRKLSSTLQTVETGLKKARVEAGLLGEQTQNSFGKAYSGAKQLANILPGLGIAGLFGVAITAVQALGEAFVSTFNKAKLFRETTEDAIGKSAAEVFKINAAVSVIKDLNSSLDAQTNARTFLNKETGISLDLLSKEKIGSDETAAAIKRVTDALFQKALAEAFAAKSAAKQVELFEKQQKLNAALANAPTTPLGVLINPLGLAQAATAAGLLEKQIEDIRKEIQAIETFGQDAFKRAFDVPPPPTKPIKVKVEVKDFVLPEGLRPIKVPIEFDFSNFFSTQIPKDLFKDANIFGDTTKIIKGIVPGASEDVAKRNKEFFDNFQKQILATADLITGVLAPAFTGMFDAIIEGQNPLKAFFDGLKDSVNQLIKKLIQAAIQAAVLKALGFVTTGGASSFSGIFSSLLGGAFGGQGNFGLGGAIGSRSFNNAITVNVVGQISGSTINLVSQRAANSSGRFG